MIESLPDTLREMGYRLEESSEGFEVRLPLFCSVRVRSEEGRISLDPRFGLVSRSAATWGMWSIALIVLLFWFAFERDSADQFYVVVLMMFLAVIWDVYRYILTEHAMYSVRQVYLATRSHRA